MNKLKHLWSNLRASFWFLPSLIVAFSTFLALGMIEFDSSGSRDWMLDLPRLFGADAAGARGMLAIGGIGTLIFFIHHIASSIQALSIIASVTKETLVAESFDEIRDSAEGNVAIMIRMLDALQNIASLTDSPNRHRVLREQAECIAELAERSIDSPRDRARVENRIVQVREALKTVPSELRPNLKAALR